MNYQTYYTRRLKRDILTILAVLLLAAISFKVSAQVPDTTVTIKTTNNQIYELNALLRVANQQLLTSKMSVADYVEFEKRYQALLSAWFKQKEDQLKKAVKPVTAKP